MTRTWVRHTTCLFSPGPRGDRNRCRGRVPRLHESKSLVVPTPEGSPTPWAVVIPWPNLIQPARYAAVWATRGGGPQLFRTDAWQRFMCFGQVAIDTPLHIIETAFPPRVRLSMFGRIGRAGDLPTKVWTEVGLTVKMGVPGACYLVQNWFYFVGCSQLSISLFTVTKQTSILMTALLWFLAFGRQLCQCASGLPAKTCATLVATHVRRAVAAAHLCRQRCSEDGVDAIPQSGGVPRGSLRPSHYPRDGPRALACLDCSPATILVHLATVPRGGCVLLHIDECRPGGRNGSRAVGWAVSWMGGRRCRGRSGGRSVGRWDGHKVGRPGGGTGWSACRAVGRSDGRGAIGRSAAGSLVPADEVQHVCLRHPASLGTPNDLRRLCVGQGNMAHDRAWIRQLRLAERDDIARSACTAHDQGHPACQLACARLVAIRPPRLSQRVNSGACFSVCSCVRLR